MKPPRFLFLLLIPILLAGCETLSQRDKQVLRAHEVSPDVYDKMLYGDPLSLADVIELSHRAVPPGLIIRYMEDTDTIYRLRKADARALRAAGVNEAVISYMLSTGAPYGPVVYQGGYPYGAPYGYPYGYPYGPYGYYGGDLYGGPVVFVGGGYYHHGWGGGRGGWGGHGGGGHHDR